MARGKSKNKLQSAEKVSALLKGDEDALAEQAEKGGNAKPPEKKPFPGDRPLPEAKPAEEAPKQEVDVDLNAAAKALGVTPEQLKSLLDQSGLKQKGEAPPRPGEGKPDADAPLWKRQLWDEDGRGKGSPFLSLFMRQHRGTGGGVAVGAALSAADAGGVEKVLNDPEELKRRLNAHKAKVLASLRSAQSGGGATPPAPSK